MSPRVSLILPVHDNLATLAEAIQSIIAQSYTDWELFLISDHSPREEWEYLSRIDHPKIQIFRNHKRGISSALNYGIRLSKAPFIARMDADDICHPERLTKQVAILEKEPGTGIVASRVEYMGDSAGFRRFVNWQNKLVTTDAMISHRFQDAVICHPSVMMRRSLFHAFGSYAEGQLPEDFELWLRWFENGIVFRKTDETLLTWRDLPERLSRSNPSYAPPAFWKVKLKYFIRFFRNSLPKETRCIVIGKGRLVNKKIAMLCDAGILVVKQVDFREHPGSARFIMYEDLLPVKNEFVVSLVRHFSGRIKIENFLEDRGFVAGKNYLMLE